MRLIDIVNEGGAIDMMALAKRAKALLAQGMSEQQAQDKLVKEGIPARLAAQAVQMAQMSETVADQLTLEAPIAATDDPMDPMIHSHEKANPMTLKGRIFQARKQLQELAQMAESDNLATWVQITKLAKGGMFMGLEQNLEQIRHGLEELAAKRRKGGVQSKGIEKFDESSDYEFDMKLAKILKQRGYKGPVKLEQLGMKWVEAIGDIVDIDDYIMVQGKDPKYDGWVSYVYNLGKYAYGAEMGYTTGTAKRVEIDTRNDAVTETATPGGTSAGMVSVGAVYKNKAGKTPKNKDGTAKNALDMKANLLTGGSIAKR